MHTLATLKLGLMDLLTKRRDDLLLSKSGNFYLADLEEQKNAIDALPPVLTGGTPLAAEIDALDARHDGYGGILFFTTEAVLRDPEATPEQKAAARRIRDELVPSLDQLNAAYVVEAQRAVERRPKLDSMKAYLDLFHAPGGGTLSDVAEKFVQAGETLHSMLSDRADVSKATRKAATALRPATIGLLNRLRADLVRDITKNASLPRDLEKRVFGYLDLLEAMNEKKPEAEPEAQPKPDGKAEPETKAETKPVTDAAPKADAKPKADQ